MLELDHLVVAAGTLEEGARWVQARCGVAPEPGGAHPGFGTHNALLRLGDDVYLEVLAPDPAQPAPAAGRLFGLDAPSVAGRLAAGPFLLHWVARTRALREDLGALARAAGLRPDELGAPTPMQRGALRWTLAVRADRGRPPHGLPSLIDWGGAAHPCARLPDRSVRLGRLDLSAPPAAVAALAGLVHDARLRLTASEEAALELTVGRAAAAGDRALDLDPARCALVVIDLQRGIVALPTAPRPAAEVVANARRLLDAQRAAGGLVVLVRVTPRPDGRDALHPAADAGAPPPRGEGFADLVPELGQRDDDLVVTKRQWGAFYGTELDLQLRRRGIRTVVLCGINTSIGVESTARDAYERGYEQVFVEDAMTSRSAEEHAHTVTRIFPRIGRVRSTAEVVAALVPQ